MVVSPARRSFTGGIVFNPAIPAGFVNAGKREALGRLTSAPPYSSIKVSDTSLDHLLLGTAADWVIIRLCFAAGKSMLRSQVPLGMSKFRLRLADKVKAVASREIIIVVPAAPSDFGVLFNAAGLGIIWADNPHNIPHL
jgi:hypothetical protein